MGELTFNHGRESTGADPLFPVPWPDAAASGSTCYKMAGIGDEAGQGEVGSIWKKARAKVRTSRQVEPPFLLQR